MAPAPRIRTLAQPDIDVLVDWAAGEGWNPGIADAAAFRSADPEGFLGAFVDDRMVAGISALAYDDRFGFIGLYICDPAMRGLGHGRAVWDAGMARLGSRTIGLDAVPAQQANYGSMGFLPSYGTLRYSGRLKTLPPSDSDAILTADFRLVESFDRSFFPAARPSFLQAWLEPPHIALTHTEDGTVAGYGVARQCREGYKIGPLFARDERTARSLLAALAARCDDAIHLDVPDTAERFGEWLQDEGLEPGFATTRMYRGPKPVIALDGVFAITTLELG
ncbi:GNAT family N-acetyltransferase [Mesorhizobium sp. CAU 1741]|uniref:GNAT family N-acetyltransferase n=1 Tax=Mesorhizobium sp. CAU 1741 TaxID=3140366 RepID=UPI00325B874E